MKPASSCRRESSPLGTSVATECDVSVPAASRGFAHWTEERGAGAGTRVSRLGGAGGAVAGGRVGACCVAVDGARSRGAGAGGCTAGGRRAVARVCARAV